MSEMTGMTIKQYHIQEYLDAIKRLNEITEGGLKDEDKREFILLNIEIHQLRGYIPKHFAKIKANYEPRRKPIVKRKTLDYDSTRDFDGETFKYLTWQPTKYAIEQMKERALNSGMRVRITKTSDGYHIWTRKVDERKMKKR
jgi:hypothetical protein